MNSFYHFGLALPLKLRVYFSCAATPRKLNKVEAKIISLKKRAKGVHLSWDEVLFIKWYTSGYTAPEIKNALDWPRRTVERSIEDLKLRALKNELKRERKGTHRARRPQRTPIGTKGSS